MTQDQHKIEVNKLNKIEDELTKLISSTDNEILYSKFLKWQKQRLICNEGFVKFIKEQLSKPVVEKNKNCVHPRSKRTYIGSGYLRCGECGKEFK